MVQAYSVHAAASGCSAGCWAQPAGAAAVCARRLKAKLRTAEQELAELQPRRGSAGRPSGGSGSADRTRLRQLEQELVEARSREERHRKERAGLKKERDELRKELQAGAQPRVSKGEGIGRWAGGAERAWRLRSRGLRGSGSDPIGLRWQFKVTRLPAPALPPPRRVSEQRYRLLQIEKEAAELKASTACWMRRPCLAAACGQACASCVPLHAIYSCPCPGPGLPACLPADAARRGGGAEGAGGGTGGGAARGAGAAGGAGRRRCRGAARAAGAAAGAAGTAGHGSAAGAAAAGHGGAGGSSWSRGGGGRLCAAAAATAYDAGRGGALV